MTTPTLNLRPSRPELRRFLYQFAMVAAIFCLLAWVAHKLVIAVVLAIACGYALLAALLLPPAGLVIYYPWVLLGWLLAHTISPVVSALIYYSVLTPLSLKRRLFGHDRLMLKKDSARTTYWRKSDKLGKDDLEHMF